MIHGIGMPHTTTVPMISPVTTKVHLLTITTLFLSFLPEIEARNEDFKSCLRQCEGSGNYSGLKAFWHNVICPATCAILFLGTSNDHNFK